MVKHLNRGQALHEGQAGFRVSSCVDTYTLLMSYIVQGRLGEGKWTYTFFRWMWEGNNCIGVCNIGWDLTYSGMLV